MDEGNKISGVDDKEMVVVNKPVGLKAAMAKAALPEEKKKKTKNDAVTELDSTCILSQKGNS